MVWVQSVNSGYDRLVVDRDHTKPVDCIRSLGAELARVKKATGVK